MHREDCSVHQVKGDKVTKRRKQQDQDKQNREKNNNTKSVHTLSVSCVIESIISSIFAFVSQVLVNKDMGERHIEFGYCCWYCKTSFHLFHLISDTNTNELMMMTMNQTSELLCDAWTKSSRRSPTSASSPLICRHVKSLSSPSLTSSSLSSRRDNKQFQSDFTFPLFLSHSANKGWQISPFFYIFRPRHRLTHTPAAAADTFSLSLPLAFPYDCFWMGDYPVKQIFMFFDRLQSNS